LDNDAPYVEDNENIVTLPSTMHVK
jgi:hypothetical protein